MRNIPRTFPHKFHFSLTKFSKWDQETQQYLNKIGTMTTTQQNQNGSTNRNWCFTLNNWTMEEYSALLEYEKPNYVVIGKETAPDTGTPHLQGYMYFKTPVRLSQLKKLNSRAHWEICKGTQEQNVTYCKKDHLWEERGERQMTPEEKGKKGAEKIAARWELVKQRKWELLPPEQLKQYMFAEQAIKPMPQDNDAMDNIWVYGKSGSGKSRWCRQTYPGFYWKGMSKWWDGYKGEEVVVLDDFDPGHAEKLTYYLKIWTDHYAFNAEVKGAMLKIRPKTFIVTSQYTIDEAFAHMDDQAREAIKRRFTVKTIGEPTVWPIFANTFKPPTRSPIWDDDLNRLIPSQDAQVDWDIDFSLLSRSDGDTIDPIHTPMKKPKSTVIPATPVSPVNWPKLGRLITETPEDEQSLYSQCFVCNSDTKQDICTVCGFHQ